MVSRNPRDMALAVVDRMILGAIAEAKEEMLPQWDDQQNAEYLTTLRQVRRWVPEMLGREEDLNAIEEACGDLGKEEGPRSIRQLWVCFRDRIDVIEPPFGEPFEDDEE